LVNAWGKADADSFLTAAQQPAAIGVGLLRRGDDSTLLPAEGIPGAGYAADGTDAARLARSGRALIMDPSSVAAARAVAAEPGQRVLDLAAAPGGKTAILWDVMVGSGLLVAADRNRRRVLSARRRLDKMGIRPHWVVMDGSRPALRSDSFDRVLLDAPCTGLGTLRRRPEIRHRLDRASPARAAALQSVLLAEALRLVKPGGRVVYSVCTVFPEETIEMVAGLPAAPPAGLPGRAWGNGLLLAPHLTGTDGMFISVVTRP
jgi:16S rRNA (cytosine967-C5)-methyltransferase